MRLREWGEKPGGAVAMMSLSPCAQGQKTLLEAPECSAMWWRSGTHIPLARVPGREALIPYSPNVYWALLFSCKSWILLLPRSP